jgi:RNA polymerase sigma-70 factor (ECF subfamily)
MTAHESDREERTSLEGMLAESLPALRSLALRLIGNYADAEDLAQEAMVRALGSLESFRGESTLRTWLFSITIHVCLDHLRGKQRWRWDAQVDAETECHATPERHRQLMGV